MYVILIYFDSAIFVMYGSINNTVNKPQKPTFFQTARMKEQANENAHALRFAKLSRKKCRVGEL